MTNWCVGDLKIRGTKENILSFLKNEWLVEVYEDKIPFRVTYQNIKWIEDENHYHVISLTTNRRIRLKRSMAHFVEKKEYNFEFYKGVGENEIIVIPEFQAPDSIDVNVLVSLSKEYSIDIKIYAFERGTEYNLNFEVQKGQIIKDDKIKFKNYAWECVSPLVGG